MTRTKKILIGALSTISLLIAFAIITLVQTSTAIMSYNDQFVNNSTETLEVRVEYIDRQNEDRFWKEEVFTIREGESVTNQIKHVRFVAECIGITGADGDKWLSAVNILETINGEWHDLPSIRKYVITGEDRELPYCLDTYAN